jgi:hypothetical protein
MRVELHRWDSQTSWAYLRPLTGHDELALDAESDRGGNWLLQRLLDDRPGGALGPASLGSLDMANRDRLLAALFRTCFGESVDGVTRCACCGEDFEFHFTLPALAAYQDSADAAPAAEGPDAQGYYRLEGARFRLPTVADLDAVGTLPADHAIPALLDRCVAADRALPDDALPDMATIQEAMERLTPSLDLDIDATCPNCTQPTTIAFSLESFLMQALAQERRFLTVEIHRLAAAYGWGLDEILRLSREDRRNLVRLVEAEHSAGGRR